MTPTAPPPTAVPGGSSTDLGAARPAAAGRRALGTRTGVATTSRDPSFEPLPGAAGYHGRLGEAVYRIEIPAGWNGGGLVIWAHGFRGFAREVHVSSPPRALREAIVASGYAWAASSFSENAYTPGIGADDSLSLAGFFEARFGRPTRTIIAGESMGGNVVVLALEHWPAAFDAGLSFCGAVGGEEVLDYILSWGMLGEYFSGTRLPVDEPSSTALAAVLQMGIVLGLPGSFTLPGLRFESAVRELTGGPRPFFAEGLAAQFTLNSGLLITDSERKSVAVAAATNASTVYEIDAATGATAAALNDGIRRIAPRPGARDPSAHPDAVPTSGRLSAPLLALHNTGDLFVPISTEVAYRLKVEDLGLGDLLVQRAIRDGGHCLFSAAEYRAAWSDLRGWVEEGRRPAGEILGPDLTDAGRAFTDPVRPGDPGGR